MADLADEIRGHLGSVGDASQRIDLMLETCRHNCRHVPQETRALAAIAMRAAIEHIRWAFSDCAIQELGPERRTDVDELHRELAFISLRLFEKDELLEAARRELCSLRDSTTTGSRGSLSHLLRQIEVSLSTKSGWDTFTREFEINHAGCLDRISRRFPELTRTELKVCVLLKLRKSTKEVAHILCTSPKNIEMHRYRIRKKLLLRPSQDIVDALADEGIAGEGDEESWLECGGETARSSGARQRK